MFLPVVIRELSVRARLRSTFYVRVVAAGIIALVVAVGLTVQAVGGSLVGAAAIGSGLLQVMVSLLLLYVLVEGVRQASGGISQERREGTLGFLFLTDLSSLDVLLGKLSGAAVNALYTLLATLPFAALALLFGGVTGGEFFRDMLALLTALAVALGCGAWASVRCRDAMVAVAVATGLVLGALILPLGLDALWQTRAGAGAGSFELQAIMVGRFSPLATVALAGDLNHRSGAGAAAYWWSLAAQMALASLLVGDAARRLQAMWRRDENAPRAPRKARRPGQAGADSGRLIAHTLAARIHLGRWLVALAVLTFVAHVGTFYQLFRTSSSPGMDIGGMLTSLPTGLASLARLLLFVQLATRTFADARQSGEMEILLTTRLDNAELVRLLWLALRRVVICLAGLDVLFGLVDSWLAMVQLPPATTPMALRWSVGLAPVLTSLAGVFAWVALAWSAMWFGISSRGTTAAVAKAFGLDLAILAIAYVGGGLGALGLQIMTTVSWPGSSWPILLHFLPILALLIGLNWLRWRWARTNLTLWFRQAAAGLLP